MPKYTLTTRGRIVVAILAVSIVLIALSAIASLATPAPAPLPGVTPSSPGIPLPEITSPSPEGNPLPDTSPSPDITSPVPEVSPSPDAAPTSPDVSPAPDASSPPNAVDNFDTISTPSPVTPAPSKPAPSTPTPTASTLSFILTLREELELDSDTLALVDTFLENPDYPEDFLVVTETPLLDSADSLKIAQLMTEVLTGRGISRDQLVYRSRTQPLNGDGIEVTLFYIPRVSK